MNQRTSYFYMEKFTVSDWCTALHNKCFWLIDWLVALFLCRAWLFYSYQIIVFFLSAFKMSSRNIYTTKKVASILRRSKKSKLSIGKNHRRNVLKTLLSLVGSWISTVPMIFDAVFCFLPDFLFENGLEWSLCWLTNCLKKNSEPFRTG